MSRHFTSIMPRSVPVSYTHLDVYKRQTLNNPSSRTLAVGLYAFKGENTVDWTGIAAGGSIAVIPVSYTHLDVYKRQVVLLPSLKHLNHGNVISPQFPILVMLDIIYGYYVEQNKYIREGMHDSTPVSYTHLMGLCLAYAG